MQEIIEATRICVAAGIAPIFHFHEGANVHDNQIEKLYVGAEPESHADTTDDSRNLSPKKETKTETDDPLFYALLEDCEVYRHVTSQCRFCHELKDIRERLRKPLREKIGKRAATTAFASLLIPHLTNYRNKLSPRYIAGAL